MKKQLTAAIIAVMLLLTACSSGEVASGSRRSDDDRGSSFSQSATAEASADAKAIYNVTVEVIVDAYTRGLNLRFPHGYVDFVINDDGGGEDWVLNGNPEPQWFSDRLAERLLDLELSRGIARIWFDNSDDSVAVAWLPRGGYSDLPTFRDGVWYKMENPYTTVSGALAGLHTGGGTTTLAPADADPYQRQTRPPETSAAPTMPPEQPSDEPQGSFDFGAIRFSSTDFVLEYDTFFMVGGNPQQGSGASAIRLAGFVGTAPDSWLQSDANPFRNEPQNRTWANLISQNGEFWENISRIETALVLESSGNAEDIGHMEGFMLGGGLTGFTWHQSGINEIYDRGYDFAWGNTIRLTWDIDDFKEMHGRRVNSHNPEGDYVFDLPANDIAEAYDEPLVIGGGLNSFGFRIRNDCIDSNISVRINWTDVVIYVHCMTTYNAHLSKLAAITGGHFAPSANTEGRVRLA
jgi:hypothetical protein